MVLSTEKIIPKIICLVILLQNPVWLVWGIGTELSFILLCFLFVILYPRRRRLRKDYVFFSLFILLPVFVIRPLFSGFHLSGVLYLLLFLMLPCITYSEGEKALNILTNILSLIITISLPMWLIHVFIVPIPHIGYFDLSQLKGSEAIYENHIFFVSFVGNEGYYRFYSMFDEPGVLGTLSAFILFARKDEFNTKNIIILLGGIFTYSLAFYILSIVGFLYAYTKKPKTLLLVIFISFPIAFSINYFLKDDIAYQQAIIYRLGDNSLEENLDRRTNYRVDRYYNNMVSTFDGLWGLGSKKIDALGLDEGQSYKRFVLEFGTLGLLSMLILYFLIIKTRYSYLSIGFYIIFFLSFLQRPFAWTGWQILLFYSVVCSFKMSDFSIEKQNS